MNNEAHQLNIFLLVSTLIYFIINLLSGNLFHSQEACNKLPSNTSINGDVTVGMHTAIGVTINQACC